MSDKSRSHRHGCCAAIAVCAAIVPAVADAQDAEIDRIEAIERKVRRLESELQRLKANSVKRSSSSDNRATRCGALKTRGLRLARTLSPGKIALTPAPANAIKLSLE